MKSGTTRPKPFVAFIIEAIDEVAPGRGAETYWRAFHRMEKYAAARRQADAEREARCGGAHPEQWTRAP
jgi:hypothetical protein